MSDLSAQIPETSTDEHEPSGRLAMRTLSVLLIPLASVLISGVVLHLTNSTTPPPPGLPAQMVASPVIPIIVTTIFLIALLVLVRLGRPTTSALLLIGAWTLMTTLGLLRSGLSSPWPALLIMPICAAGLVIDGAASLSLAALATVLVAALGWLETQGLYVAREQATAFAVQPPALAIVGFWVALFWTMALLTWTLAGELQRALQRSREQAQALRELSASLETRVAAQTAELAQRAARAEALYEVSQALTSTLDLNQVLGLITEQAARLLNFDSAEVLLRQEDGSFASLGAYGRPGVSSRDASALELISTELWERREPRVVSWPKSGQEPDRATDLALALPMRYGTSVSGVLILSNASGQVDCQPDDLILGQGLADQAAVAIANAQLLTQAREAAMLEERTRLARDIHDTLAQGLTGIVVQLGAALRALIVAPDETREHLVLAQRMARESLAEARRSVWNLRAPALDRGDLADALRSVAVRPLGSDVAVTFEQAGEPWPLTTAIESTLLRVAQEALANVARHSQATEAWMALIYMTDSVQLSVRDNGVGFDPEAGPEKGITPGPWGGFGLLGMEERVSALGGTLTLSSQDGTLLLATIPRPASAAPAGQIVMSEREGAK